MTDIVQVLLLSMTPLGELRLSIPIGLLVYHIDILSVFFVSVIGNFIPALFILVFLKKISQYLSQKSQFFHKFFGWWENRAKNSQSKKLKSYGAIGLALFVAVPLPLTGAWTGALLATIMDLPLKKSIPAVLAGVVGAGLIVTTLVLLGVNIEKYLGLPTLIGILIFITFTYFIWKFFNQKFKK